MKLGQAQKKYQKTSYMLVSIGLTVLFWQVLATVINRPIILPTPMATIKALAEIISAKGFLMIVITTLKRYLVGFFITFCLALLLGTVAGLSVLVDYLLKPVVTALKAVPTMAIILLAIIWLQSEYAPMLVVFLVVFPIIYHNVVQGIHQVDQRLIEMAQVYQVGRYKMLKDIYLASAWPYLEAGLTTALGLGFKVVIAAEVLSQPKSGIGTAFQIEKSYLNTAGVFAWAIISILLVAGFDLVLKMVRNHRKIRRKKGQNNQLAG